MGARNLKLFMKHYAHPAGRKKLVLSYELLRLGMAMKALKDHFSNFKRIFQGGENFVIKIIVYYYHLSFDK